MKEPVVSARRVPEGSLPVSGEAPALRMPPRTILALSAINFLWAGTAVAAKVALESVSPLTLAFFRFSLAAVLMYAVARLMRVDLRVRRRDWSRFWAMGVLGLTFTYVLTYVGMRHTMASHAALLIATEPVFLTILSALFLRERMTAPKVCAITVGLAGVYLIVCNGWLPHAAGGTLLGDGLIALGLIFEVSASIVGKGLVERYPAVSVMTYEMTIGALALAPLCVWEMLAPAGHGSHHFFPLALGALAYLIVPCTVLAYTVWYTILERRDASEMSPFLYIQPVAGAFLGWWLLGDRISLFTVWGALLVLLALMALTSAGSADKVRPLPE